MSPIAGKIFRFIFYSLSVVLLIWVSGQLFFERQFNDWTDTIRNIFSEETGDEVESLDILRVIYPSETLSLEPTLSDPVSRQRLVNIYEPLVVADRSFTIKPSLALSWGLIDENTWQFSLREGVVFHDGSSLDIEDVIVSIDRAKTFSKSELVGRTDTIEDIKKISDTVFQIKTSMPDPLLLQKLSTIFIIPSEFVDNDIKEPIGTGPYRFDSWIKGERMVLRGFENYWGNKPKFDKIELYPIINKEERVNKFINGEADILTFVPYDSVSLVNDKGFNIAAIPTLEVQFLVFDNRSEMLSDPVKREIVSMAIDNVSLAENIGEYVMPVNQYVSTGIFGFNPDIEKHKYFPEEAEKLVKDEGIYGSTLKFHLPEGLEILGEHVRDELYQAGINLDVEYLSSDDLLNSILNQEADIYFLGFKADLGDASGFLKTIVHSEGDFNLFGYSNEELDELLDLAQIEMDTTKRRDMLQEAMRIVVEDDFIGVPLFEYETVFGFCNKFDLEPRVDGLIYFDELIIK